MKRLPLLIVLGSVALLALVVALQPRPLDWRPDYEAASARPLGGRVFFELLPRWLAGSDGRPARVEAVPGPPFERLADTTLVGTAYVFVTDAFAPDEAEVDRLVAYAARGNTVLVAAEGLEGVLADTLGRPGADEGGVWFAFDGPGADSTLRLVGPAVRGDFHLPIEPGAFELRDLDPARTTALGTRAGSADGDTLVTLARVRVGRGQVILSSTPRAFSNAALVGEGGGAAYVSGVLGYVEARTVLWDEHYKPLRGREPRTPLRHVLRQPALRWAYVLTLLGVALYVIFRGRRWQRAIPVVAPPPNAAVDFVRTLGRLYHQHGDGRAHVERRARHFFDRLRARHGLNELAPGDFSEAAERAVARRTGVAPALTGAVFARFRRLGGPAAPGAADLVELDRALDRFRRAAEGETVGR